MLAVRSDTVETPPVQPIVDGAVMWELLILQFPATASENSLMRG
jgi:hypothetical protein